MFKFVVMLYSTLFLLFASPSFSAQWDVNRLPGTTKINDIDTETQAQHASLDRLLSNYRQGMKLTYSTGSTLVVSTGEVMVSNSGATVRLMMSTASSTNVTFSDLDTGAEGANTVYYVYAIASDATATTATFKVSANSSAPSGVTYYKRLGYFTNNSGSDIDASTIVNDDLPTSSEIQNGTLYLKNNVNLEGHTISNGFLGQTTTGTLLVDSGDTEIAPTGCYLYGGAKQVDGNFRTLYYACP